MTPKINTAQTADSVVIPLEAPPEFGTLVEVAPGILWAQLPLPYQPGHVNTYLIEDGDGWVAVDTGLDDDDTKAAWERIIASLPGYRRISKVLVTHWHSDHSGSAGWLCRRFDAPLVTSETEYLKLLQMELMSRAEAGEIERAFYASHGLEGEILAQWVAQGHDYLYMLSAMPRTYHRLHAGDLFRSGQREFVVMTAPGHSPEEVMLKSSTGDVFLCADQLGPKIAPNIAVQANDPLGDPLAVYFRALDQIVAEVPRQALLLPGHEQPFRGLAVRVGQLKNYYSRRCGIVEAACAETPKTALELVSSLFRKPPGPVWIGFVMSEAVTYANHLVANGRLEPVTQRGVIRYRALGFESGERAT